MSAGGKRPGAGRKPQKIVHQIILRETQPGRYEQIEAATEADLTPLAVMHDNMKFFHRKAGELMAAILALPTLTHDEVEDAQVQALKDMAGLLHMREMAQQCARDLAPYLHARKAQQTAKEAAQEAGKAQAAITHVPTPKSILDAFARAAAGLPQEQRRRL